MKFTKYFKLQKQTILIVFFWIMGLIVTVWGAYSEFQKPYPPLPPTVEIPRF